MNHYQTIASSAAAAMVVLYTLTAAAAPKADTLKFSFGGGEAPVGFTHVMADDQYTVDRGYGFEGSPGPSATAKAVGGDEPFFFSVKLPEGNYRVTLVLDGGTSGAAMTVKAESRQLMLENVNVKPNAASEQTFAVNVRTPQLPNGKSVAMRDAKNPGNAWDDKLTLEFNGTHPAVRSLVIEPVSDAVTVFIAGDSTVKDQSTEPWSGWGQMLPRFFDANIAIANHSESGRTLRSFRGDRRLDKVLSQIGKGDYLLIQFGHNDMKEKGQGIGPFESFSDDLRSYIEKARDMGATVVVITPMNRLSWEGNEVSNTHGDYPEAVRRVAKEENVAIIDLHTMSKTLYEAVGKSDASRLFVHYPANTFPGQTERLKDNSHFSPYGAYELARCIVEGLRESDVPLVNHLRDDAGHFNPAKPDAFEDFDVPFSPLMASEKPEGN